MATGKQQTAAVWFRKALVYVTLLFAASIFLPLEAGSTPTPTETATPSETPTATNTPGANDCCDCGAFCAPPVGSCGLCDTVFGAVCGGGGQCNTFTPTVTVTPTSTPTPSFTWTAGPSPTETFTPENTPTPTITPTPLNTPTPLVCCQCPNPACGPATTPGTDSCGAGCSNVPHGVCSGGSGLCLTVTPTGTITLTRTRTSTPTQTPTQTLTVTVTRTPTLGGFLTDNFKCYRVRPNQKFARVDGVSVIDELEPGGKATRLIKPSLLCTPADRDGEGMMHPEDYLLCFKTRDEPHQQRFVKKQATVRNQYGESLAVTVLSSGYLCIPSRLLSARTATPTP